MDADTREFVLTIQKAAKKATEDYIRLAERKYGRSFPMPAIQFNMLGTTAGRAWSGKNLIEYNPRILRLNAEEFLVETTGHEVAHLIAHHLHTQRIDPHGSEWTRVMWAFSLPARRCHNYDTGNAPARKRAEAYETADGVVRPVRVGRIITFD